MTQNRTMAIFFRGKYLKYLFLAVPLFLAVGIFWHLQKPFGLESGAGQLLTLTAGPEGTIVTGLHLVQLDDLRTHWTLDAPSARRDPLDDIVIDTPKLSVFQGNGEKLEINAIKGALNNSTREMTFRGGVTADSGPFNHLSTEWLRFNPNQQVLFTDQFFRLDGEHLHLQGIGLTVHQKTRTLKVSKQVKMTFTEGFDVEGVP